ncbi:ribosome maturation factor RimM [Lentibacillus halophilus]|uniref:Ribosome maturation factor RimM n=1 Tax=Lentibacillus halophilus TaxID=295065 RepID=A0ABN0ZEN4_9BACI
MTQMLNVGKIINTHGVQGEVKVQRITDFDDRFDIGNQLVLVNEDSQELVLTIDGHRIHKGFDLIHFKGYDTINDVEWFKGKHLQISENQLTELDENEYYYHEIIGCSAYLTDGSYLGSIKEILSPGANDVWVVKREQGKDVLVPYIENIVQEVDVAAQKVVIEPMEGLLD